MRRFADRMKQPGRYHVFRAGDRHYLNGEMLMAAPYRKRGHASAGAWIARDAKGNVTAEDVVCFEEVLASHEVERHARTPSAAQNPRAVSTLRTA